MNFRELFIHKCVHFLIIHLLCIYYGGVLGYGETTMER